MKPGDLVSSSVFNTMGIITKKLEDKQPRYFFHYQCTIEILQNSGSLIIFDIYPDDKWQVIA